MRLSLVIAASCLLGLSSATASPADAPAPAPARNAAAACSAGPAVVLPAPEVSVLPAAGGANATFSGCWTRYSGGTCRGIYVVDGVHKICGACGPGGTPPKYNGQCTTISSTTLASGLWCS